jgi:hypothetical protein
MLFLQERPVMMRMFPPYTNTLARVGLFGAVFGPIALGLAAMSFNWSPYITRVNVGREQPVPFSHKHHVGGLGLDCRYCHTSVEDSSFATIPPMKTCMTCHSQIWKESPMLAPVRDSYAANVPLQWNRVHDLPDFVYFNHSIHVHKGIGCETCHGRVDQMPLMSKANTLYMSWCLSCHRDPARFVRPREEVFTMGYHPSQNQRVLGAALMKNYHIRKLQDCYTCHR